MDARSDYFGKGLRSLGLQQREKLVIYADTRADWLMAAIGEISAMFSRGSFTNDVTLYNTDLLS